MTLCQSVCLKQPGSPLINEQLTTSRERTANSRTMRTTYAPMTIQTIAATGNDYNNNNQKYDWVYVPRTASHWLLLQSMRLRTDDTAQHHVKHHLFHYQAIINSKVYSNSSSVAQACDVYYQRLTLHGSDTGSDWCHLSSLLHWLTKFSVRQLWCRMLKWLSTLLSVSSTVQLILTTSSTSVFICPLGFSQISASQLSDLADATCVSLCEMQHQLRMYSQANQNQGVTTGHVRPIIWLGRV